MVGVLLSSFCVAVLATVLVGVWPRSKVGLPAEIELEFQKPPAIYIFPSVSEPEPMQHDETGNTEVDMRIALARQEEKVESLRQTVEREFMRVGQGLSDLASAMNSSVQSMKNEYVTQAAFAAMKEEHALVKRIVFGACAVMLLAVFGGMVALVTGSVR